MQRNYLYLMSLVLIGGFLLLSSPLTVSAQTPVDLLQHPNAPHTEYQAGNLTLNINNFSIHILTDSLPIFQFWDANTPDERYLVRITNLIEYNDTNGDGVPQPSERAPEGNFALASGTWEISDIQNETDGDELVAIHFNYTLTDITVPRYSSLYLQLRFHLYLENTTIESDGLQTFVIGGRELKFDLVIDEWPWVTEGDQLALSVLLTSTHGRTIRHRYMLQTRTMAWERNENTNNNASAFFRYETQFALCNNSGTFLANLTHGIEENGTSPILYLNYPYFGNSQLVHDPTIGIAVATPLQPSLPALIVLLTSPLFLAGLAIVAVVVVVLVFRRRS